MEHKYLHVPLFKKRHFQSKTTTSRKRKRSETVNSSNKKRKTDSNMTDEFLDTLMGKWKTHKYTCTTKAHPSGEVLREKIFAFFDHYCDHPDYEITKLPEFKKDLKVLKEIAQKHWTLDECEKYCRSLKTYYCESKFALRLYFLPKNTSFSKTFETRTHLVDLHWDSNHVAAFVIDYYGKGEIERRARWEERAATWIETTYKPKYCSRYATDH